MFTWLYKRYLHARGECLPDVGGTRALSLPMLPIPYLVVFGGGLGALLTLAFAGHPVLLAAFAVQVVLGAFASLIFRVKQ